MSPLKQQILFSFIVILVHVGFVRVSGFPHSSAVNVDNGNVDDMEIITVEEIVRNSNGNLAKNSTVAAGAALITPNNEAGISSSTYTSAVTFMSTSSAQNDASNEPTMIDIADDLIFLDERLEQQHDSGEDDERKIQQQQQRQELKQRTTATATTSSSTVGIFQQIDLLTSAEEDSLTAISSSTSAAMKSSEAQDYVCNKAVKVDGGAGAGDGVDVVASVAVQVSTTTSPIKHVIADKEVGIVVDEDEVSLDASDDDDVDVDVDNDDVDVDAAAAAPIAPIDMSDFVALIPVAAVKTIVANYYRTDPEVRRAYVYINSAYFKGVCHYIIDLPEAQAFLRYLNNTGLDVVGFLYTVTDVLRKPDAVLPSTTTTTTTTAGTNMIEDNFTSDDDMGSGSDAVMTNEIYNGIKLNPQSTTLPQQSVASAANTEAPAKEIDDGKKLNPQSTTLPQQSVASAASTEAPAKGFHGMVDSILEVLPQDQILATFFDKLESNEQFTRLVGHIGQPAFSKILHNLQNSATLRSLLYSMKYHGVDINRIVDSLKAYFFLGTF